MVKYKSKKIKKSRGSTKKNKIFKILKGGANASANSTLAPLKKSGYKYFIVPICGNELDYLDKAYLQKHLLDLGIEQDPLNEKYNEDFYKLFEPPQKYVPPQLRKPTLKDYCKDSWSRKQVNLPVISNVSANIFFFDINTNLINEQFYGYHKYLLNILNLDAKLLEKNNIYSGVSLINPALASKYFIEVFQIDEMDKYVFPGNYILRPTDSFAGADIKYVSNRAELTEAIEDYKKKKNYRGKLYGNNVIASKYISNLLTFQGKKFHLRMYYLVSISKSLVSQNYIFNSFLLPLCEIFTAKEKYNLDLPFTKNVHNTHEYNNYFFPRDFTTDNIGIEINTKIIDDIYSKCKEMCSGLSMIMKKEYDKNSRKFFYKEQDNGYHLFGLDVFINEDLIPILIECNDKPGIDSKTKEEQKYLSEPMYQWINDTILEPLLKYNDPLIARDNPTYISFELI